MVVPKTTLGVNSLLQGLRDLTESYSTRGYTDSSGKDTISQG